MDWITTSGRTLDEAKSHALDQLGIVADEAEFDIVSDVEKGLFGRVKSEAKIRARVRPKQTAVKEERGRRRGNGSGSGRNRNQKGGGRGGNNKGRKSESDRKDGNGDGGDGQRQRGGRSGGSAGENGKRSKSGKGRGGNEGSRNDGRNKSDGSGETRSKKTDAPKKSEKPTKSNNAKRDTVDEHMSREDQERAAQGFLEGVLDAFQMTGSVAVVEEPADDDAIEMVVTGEELGLLVGQKGITLNSLQELTRTVVQRVADGAKTDRLRVDVAGYRARRTQALQAFAAQIAADVLESGTEKLLEPMGPADRKVVHDAVNDIDGVETGSEGEEPRRRVVIRPV